MKKSFLFFLFLMIALAALLITCQSGTETNSLDNLNSKTDTEYLKQPIRFGSTIENNKSSSPENKSLDTNQSFLTYHVNPKTQPIKLYWKDDKGDIIRSLGNLRRYLAAQNKTLVFAANAGMYMEDRRSLGLFIQDGKVIAPLNTRNASGNFYMKPNGVFYIDKNDNAGISVTEKFVNNGKIKYATQSGPMLLVNGAIHPSFTKGSANVNIRNGVGILPNGDVVFIQSKAFVNLYDFAEAFKKLGCKNALSFDGFVSRTYLPEKGWVQEGGDFGVIVAVAR